MEKKQHEEWTFLHWKFVTRGCKFRYNEFLFFAIMVPFWGSSKVGSSAIRGHCKLLIDHYEKLSLKLYPTTITQQSM